MRQRCFLCVLLAAFVLIVPSRTFAESLVGEGGWESLSGEGIRGTWSVALDRRGDEMTGQLVLTGSNVFAGGDVSGTIDGSSVVLGVMVEGSKQAVFSGRLEGESVKGEWQSAVVKDEGVWYGSLTEE